MPDLPANHRPSAIAPRPSRWGADKVARKLTGRPWRRLRDLVLARDKYLCQKCLALSRIAQAAEVDHIVPVAKGGTDEAGNLQSLCAPCHKAKTATEGGRASTHPAWMPTPACEVILVTGAPGSGKTTWCKQQAKPADQVIDLDECFREVCGTHGHEADRKHLDSALRLRNKMIADLASKRDGIAYLIVGEPLSSWVKWWMAKLNARHVLLDPGIDACLSRVSGRRAEAAIAWYQRRNYTADLDS